MFRRSGHRFADKEHAPLKKSRACPDFKAGYEKNLRERSSNELELSLPIDYLSTSRVVGVFDRRGQLLGGFVMRFEPPFRCLQAVPEAVKSCSPLLLSVPDAQLCELT